jgi:hypothetical protein
MSTRAETIRILERPFGAVRSDIRIALPQLGVLRTPLFHKILLANVAAVFLATAACALDVLKLGLAVPTTEMTRMVVRFRVGVSPQVSRMRIRGGTVGAVFGVIRGRASAGHTAFRITLPRFDGEPQSS